MKKITAIVVLLAMVCALLFGCTPRDTEKETTASGVPVISTQQILETEQAGSSRETTGESAEPSAATAENTEAETAAETEETVEDTEIDSEAEGMTEYTVDGGDGFGIGGN